jgi:iron complex transport system substrate-binding protein
MKIKYSNKLNKIIFIGIIFSILIVSSGCTGSSKIDSKPAEGGVAPAEAAGNTGNVSESARTITDGSGRTVTIPEKTERVVCSGAGSLRYLVYLQAQDRVVGVDALEKNKAEIEGRPYVLANPQLRDYPLIGEARGKDDPEKIIQVNPQVVLKAGSLSGQSTSMDAADANSLQEKTGIPVVSFPYGSLTNETQKAQIYSSLRLMGEVVDKQERAEEVITYINATMGDLERRTSDLPESGRKNVYVGGVSFAGAHGIISTEPAYPPFLWVNAKNVAAGIGAGHADIAKEALVDWDPEYIFIDIGTLQLGNDGAIAELKTDPALKDLSAVKNGKVYGVIPYNFYTTNYESVFANSYFVGKVLYPDRFEDVDPEKKADEIYSFFLGKPVFSDLNGQYRNLGFKPISM